MPEIEQHAVPLPEEDVRAIVQMVGNVAFHEGGPAARKHALMEQLGELIDADAWMWAVSRRPQGEPSPVLLNVMHGGFTDDQIALGLEATYDPALQPPEVAPLVEELKNGAPFTRRRQDMVSDDEWRSSPHREKYRTQIGFDECIFSIFPIDGGLNSSVSLHRRMGREPFTARERRIAHIVISEIGWLHTAGLPADTAPDVPQLSPRHSTVFALLMQGWNRAKIAQHLSISEHTARDHIRAVYRHFKCDGHVDLMKRFMIGDGGDIPGTSNA